MFGLSKAVEIVERGPLGPLLTTVQRVLDPVIVLRSAGGAAGSGRDAQAVLGLRVTEILAETPDSVTVHLEPESGPEPKFRAGQYLNVVTQVEGIEHTRAYSISGPEDAGLRLTVKTVDGGTVSQKLCRELKPGQTLRATGPHGRFTLPDDAKAPLAFIAVGSGITPIFSMVATALANDSGRRIRLVYANRSPRDVIFADQLRRLGAEHPSFEVVHVLTKPDRGWRGERGRLTGERAVALLAPSSDAHAYLCGPEELMDATSRSLKSAGIEAEKVHRERFTPRARLAPGRGQNAFSVRWTRSGIVDTQRPGESLLDLGLRVDADVAYICEAGECGECKIRVLCGEVIHEPDTCLTAAESADGMVLACSSYAVTDLEVDA